ncbi:MAG: VWA domain-containing protein, partial [Planctomycetota bacterium]
MHARVRDQVARVQVEQIFRNTDHRVVEAQFLFPLPPGAAITGLTLMVDGKEIPGKLLKKDEARRIYEQIVRKHRDPALLEYVGRDLYQTSVFPVPPGKQRRVELRYTHLLSAQDGLIDFVLPVGTAKHTGRPIKRLTLELAIETTQPLKTVYSPSHDVSVKRPDEHRALVTLTLHDVAAPDDVRVLFGVKEGLLGAHLLSYRPQRDADGYFLLLVAPDIHQADRTPTAKTIVFVIDRSGSMSGTKIQQAREALKFVLQRLNRRSEKHPGDLFNIVAYDAQVESFRPELQRADDKTIAQALAFVDGIHAGGSTNIDGALKTAFGMLHDTGRPSYVVFLTDGLPTVGEQNEMRITENSRQANRVKARLFAFGVGFDVNSRLLDRLARAHGGVSLYVRPNENIEEHVARLYNRIAAPVMTDVALRFEFDGQKDTEPPPVYRVYPKPVPDLFRGEQLVVVGRYRRPGAARVVMTGRIAGEEQRFAFPVRFEDLSRDDSHSFVETLWAVRRIGEIIDELDLHGHNQELVDELVRLALKHGIVTPYTSFLAN